MLDQSKYPYTIMFLLVAGFIVGIIWSFTLPIPGNTTNNSSNSATSTSSFSTTLFTNLGKQIVDGRFTDSSNTIMFDIGDDWQAGLVPDTIEYMGSSDTLFVSVISMSSIITDSVVVEYLSNFANSKGLSLNDILSSNTEVIAGKDSKVLKYQTGESTTNMYAIPSGYKLVLVMVTTKTKNIPENMRLSLQQIFANMRIN